MPSVYIETTIPSFYHTHRRSPQAIAWRAQTRLWWDRYRHRYDLHTSEIVAVELRAAPAERASPRLRLIEEIPRLTSQPAIDRLAAHYLQQKLMPTSSTPDAVHLAFASHYGIDYLLTWNCLHLANANKATHLEVVNRRLGVHVPIMVTPYNLIPEADS